MKRVWMGLIDSVMEEKNRLFWDKVVRKSGLRDSKWDLDFSQCRYMENLSGSPR